MQVCNRCLYTSSHPLNLTFDSLGICSGCRVHEEKDQIDWSSRQERLQSIFNSYKSKSGKNYDCIIPVSGARDSYYIVHLVKNIFGMNPLLVTYNKHYNTAIGYTNLANLRTCFDCDILTLTVDPGTVKDITRSTLRRFGSLYWHCIAGQTVFPVQVAVKFKIPLIIWGAHQGLDQVGMFSHLDEVEMTRKYRKEHDLMGFEAEDLVNDFDNISESHVMPYLYPDNLQLEQIGVRGIYLNNFLRWDSRLQHEKMINTYGYSTCAQTRTFDSYNDVDCWLYSDLHDYIKYLKHGYGKVLDHAVREIRLRHMTRSQGIQLVKKYQSLKPRFSKLFFEWLGITSDSFEYIIDQHRNPLFWKRDDSWQWVGYPLEEILTSTQVSHNADLSNIDVYSDFTLTPPVQSTDPHDKFILIGKGCL